MREMSSHSSDKSESSKVKAKRFAYTLYKYACARGGGKQNYPRFRLSAKVEIILFTF